MPRFARIVVPGAMHHITQRGNDRQPVFFAPDDYRRYLDLLVEQSAMHGFRIEGYCLMTNHVHVVGVPADEDTLAKAIGRTHFHYAQHLNRSHRRSGHLWQNRYYSCPMDEAHSWNALCYVELNPVRAGIVKRPWDYNWSSAAGHCGIETASEFLDLPAWRMHTSAETWIETLRAVARNDDLVDAVRRATHTGRPLGKEDFVSRLESTYGSRIRALPVGRPSVRK